MKYNLSSSAQSIVDAYSEANDCYDETLGQIAAALRAAADLAKGNPPDMKDELSVMYSCGWDDCAKQLLAIAAELEGAE